MKTVCAAAILLSGLQEKANPDLMWNKDYGFSFSKAPKNDEWSFAEKGYFTNDKCALKHKVDNVMISVMADKPAQNSYDVAGSAEKSWESIAANPQFKEATRKGATKKVKNLPGGGGGTQQIYLVEFSLTDPQGAKLEMAHYFLEAKENKCFYRIALIGEAEAIKKHQRLIDQALSTFKFWKLPK